MKNEDNVDYYTEGDHWLMTATKYQSLCWLTRLYRHPNDQKQIHQATFELQYDLLAEAFETIHLHIKPLAQALPAALITFQHAEYKSNAHAL